MSFQPEQLKIYFTLIRVTELYTVFLLALVMDVAIN